MEEDFAPPSYPPPYLTDEQILSFATQGHIALSLSPELQQSYAQTFEAARDFFAQPDETKSQLYPSPAGHPELGFTHNAAEKQYLTLRSSSHPATALETHVRAAWRDTAMLLLRILADLARAMGLADPHRVWDGVLDGSLALPAADAEATPTIFRLFEYAPRAGVAEPHCDIGLLTLCVCRGEGLQVSHLTGGGRVWKAAEGPTLLIGTALQALTGTKVRAGLHRVVANPNGRSSIIFALRPSLRHEMDLRVFSGGVTAPLKEFWERHISERYNINASTEERERQKATIAKRKQQTQG